MALVISIEMYDASFFNTSMTSAGKSYVQPMLRQLVIWDCIAKAIIYSTESVQAVATDRK
jgi:hypothetical protein